MRQTMLGGILIRWVVTIAAVFVACSILRGITYGDWISLAILAAVLGLINAVVKPLVTILALPVVVLTLGLALMAINALLFWLASRMVPDFEVDSFWTAFLGSLIVTSISFVLSLLLD